MKKKIKEIFRLYNDVNEETAALICLLVFIHKICVEPPFGLRPASHTGLIPLDFSAQFETGMLNSSPLRPVLDVCVPPVWYVSHHEGLPVRGLSVE